VRADQSVDSLWWIVVAIASFSSLGLPNLVHIEASPGTKTLFVAMVLLFVGAVVGCLRPVRVWRWGVAAALGFVFNDLMAFVTDPQFIWSGVGVVEHVLRNAVPCCIQAVPVLVGACLGSYLMKV
jgi:hypothetical protein